jgi:hypothetical protein
MRAIEIARADGDDRLQARPDRLRRSSRRHCRFSR